MHYLRWPKYTIVVPITSAASSTVYGKLMTFYGFDMKSGIRDTKLFPITKKDKKIEGINTDRLRFNDAVKN